MPLGNMSRQAVCFCVFLCVFLIGLVNGKSQATQFDFVYIELSKTGLVSIDCYVPGVTRKELGNQIMTNYYSQRSQQQALLKFNNLLRNDKIINYKKQWRICTIKESNLQYLNFKSKLSLKISTHKSFNSF